MIAGVAGFVVVGRRDVGLVLVMGACVVAVLVVAVVGGVRLAGGLGWSGWLWGWGHRSRRADFDGTGRVDMAGAEEAAGGAAGEVAVAGGLGEGAAVVGEEGDGDVPGLGEGEVGAEGVDFGRGGEEVADGGLAGPDEELGEGELVVEGDVDQGEVGVEKVGEEAVVVDGDIVDGVVEGLGEVGGGEHAEKVTWVCGGSRGRRGER